MNGGGGGAAWPQGQGSYGAGGGGGCGSGQVFHIPAGVTGVHITAVGGGGGGGLARPNTAPLEDAFRLYALLRGLKKWRGFRMLPRHIRDEVVLILKETEHKP